MNWYAWQPVGMTTKEMLFSFWRKMMFDLEMFVWNKAEFYSYLQFRNMQSLMNHYSAIMKLTHKKSWQQCKQPSIWNQNLSIMFSQKQLKDSFVSLIRRDSINIFPDKPNSETNFNRTFQNSKSHNWFKFQFPVWFAAISDKSITGTSENLSHVHICLSKQRLPQQLLQTKQINLKEEVSLAYYLCKESTTDKLHNSSSRIHKTLWMGVQ